MAQDAHKIERVAVPTIHSVLESQGLAAAIDNRYQLDGPVRVQLLYRGMNDIYIVRDAQRRYAARAWRTAWRSIGDVDYELAFLAFLKTRGFPAAYGIPMSNGAPYFVVDAPEGPRPVALFEWAPGDKFGKSPDVETSRRMGALFAELHLMGRDFVGPNDREANSFDDFPDNTPYLLELLMERPEDRAVFPDLAIALKNRMEAIDPAGLPRGPSHGDFHFNNVHLGPAGEITFLDFDASGEDHWVQDVAAYVWANGYGGYDPAYGIAFREGYESVRPFTAAETASFELFLYTKAFRLLGQIAANVSANGHAPLRFKSLDWFCRYLRDEAQRLNIQ